MRDSYLIQYVVIILIILGIIVFKIVQARNRKKKGIKSSPCSCCSSKCSCAKSLPKEPVKPCCCCSKNVSENSTSEIKGQKSTKK